MVTEHLNVEVLKDLREQSRLFLKLDLAYIVAGGAVFTALHIGREELFRYGDQASSALHALVIVGLIDTVFESLLLVDWLRARTSNKGRLPAWMFKLFVYAQPLIHFAFVATVLTSALAFIEGGNASLTRIEGRVLLQESADSYILKMGVAPKSLSDLQSTSSNYGSVFSKLDNEEVNFESTGQKTYKITFGGWDKKIGTPDDETVTQDLKLRDVFERVMGANKP